VAVMTSFLSHAGRCLHDISTATQFSAGEFKVLSDTANPSRRKVKTKCLRIESGVRVYTQSFFDPVAGRKPIAFPVCKCASFLRSAVDVLGRVPRVPIYLSRHVHYDRQHDEECDSAHEQSVILLPQRDIEKCVHARQTCANH